MEIKQQNYMYYYVLWLIIVTKNMKQIYFIAKDKEFVLPFFMAVLFIIIQNSCFSVNKRGSGCLLDILVRLYTIS